MTRTGVLFGIVVVLFAIGGTALSIWARKTRLEQTRAFWGPQAIEAFQLAAEVDLFPPPEDASESNDASETQDTSESATPDASAVPADAGEASDRSPGEPVRLTGMPGLGHLRHVLLDERSYDWQTVADQSVRAIADAEPDAGEEIMVLRFSDPEAQRFPPASVVVDLREGRVGPQEGGRSVRLNERFRNALPNFLRRVANYEPLRAEMRQRDRSGGQ
jgi:hypothetical protein